MESCMTPADEWRETCELTSKVYAYYYADTSSDDDTEAIMADALAHRPHMSDHTYYWYPVVLR